MVNYNEVFKKQKEFQEKQIEFTEKQQRIFEKQTDLQKRQVELTENQQKIIEKQTDFSRILTLATGVLAFSALIQVIILFLKTNFGVREGWLAYLDYILFTALIFIVGVLLVYVYALLKPQKKRNNN